MKKLILISLLIGAMPLAMQAQDDDLYFVPKKKSVEKVTEAKWVDEYNRRGSSYEVIDRDTAANDIIDFSAVQGVYPDSVVSEDFALTRQMSRFDDYDLSDNDAFWAGYQAGRNSNDWGWHSPWYYRHYGWYGGWYDPWYYSSWYGGWYDPWYYSSWYGGWYDPWFYGYGWGYPYYYGYVPRYYGFGGGGHYAYRNGNTGTISRYGSTHGSLRGGTPLSGSRMGSLRERTVGAHRAVGSGTRTSGSGYRSGNSVRSNSGNFSGSRSGSYSNSSSGTFSRSSSNSGSFSSGGGSFGGGSRSSGGGGGRSGGGGSLGGRR